MGDLTANLSRSEFACKCGCGFDTIDYELVNILQDSADHFAAKYHTPIRIDITGPNRCVSHNEDVQERHVPDYKPFSSKSKHLDARAADYKLFGRQTGNQVLPELVADYLEEKYPGRLGIGRYSNRTHVDTRTGGPARWSA